MRQDLSLKDVDLKMKIIIITQHRTDQAVIFQLKFRQVDS